MRYKDICNQMDAAGWGNHAVLCAKGIADPSFNRKGKGFCMVGNIKRLDTYALFELQGRAPDSCNWVGEAATLEFYDPLSGGSTITRRLQAWIYRDKGLVEFINRKNKHLLCSLSDVEKKLTLKVGTEL
jgi:hypothetical protein